MRYSFIRRPLPRIHVHHYTILRSWLVILLCWAASDLPTCAAQTSPRSDEDKLRAAQAVLDNANWYKDDPDMGFPEAPPSDATMQAISEKELRAASTIIELDLPLSAKSKLLVKYVRHHNMAVRYLIANSLILLGIWDANDALRFGYNENSLSAWSLLLQASRPRKKVGRVIASEALEYILNNPADSTPDVQRMLTEIARLLASSGAARDAELLSRAAQKYSDNLMIWLAASRFAANPELVKAARLVYGNMQYTLAVRLAAALVFGKEDPDVQQVIVHETLDFAQRFGTDDWHSKAYGSPPNPALSQRIKEFNEQRQILAVFAELPASALSKHLDAFLSCQHGLVGDVLFGVFAKAAPEALVKHLEEHGTILPNIHNPLVLAGELHPELRPRIETLIGVSEYSQLRTKALEASKLTGFTETPLDALTFASQVTLWD